MHMKEGENRQRSKGENLVSKIFSKFVCGSADLKAEQSNVNFQEVLLEYSHMRELEFCISLELFQRNPDKPVPFSGLISNTEAHEKGVEAVRIIRQTVEEGGGYLPYGTAVMLGEKEKFISVKARKPQFPYIGSPGLDVDFSNVLPSKYTLAIKIPPPTLDIKAIREKSRPTYPVLPLGGFEGRIINRWGEVFSVRGTNTISAAADVMMDFAKKPRRIISPK